MDLSSVLPQLLLIPLFDTDLAIGTGSLSLYHHINSVQNLYCKFRNQSPTKPILTSYHTPRCPIHATLQSGSGRHVTVGMMFTSLSLCEVCHYHSWQRIALHR